ncbi:oxoglutarate iron-dependent oxygenase [Colletotrichum higginsianum]|nr:oxoglutarate iron-dependent oxygenase [Colletotrichum higginsianum]
MGDLDFLIFFQFYRMVILPDDTPLDVWRRGHGGVFHFTVLDQHQNALKPACYHGFLCKAVDTTPRDH